MHHSRLVTVLLLALSALSASGAWAEDKTSAASPEYRDLIRKALQEYEIGNYAEARVFFSDAHVVFPNARTLRGLALAAYGLRDYVAAVDYCERALDNPVQPLSNEQRTGVGEFLTQARRLVAHVKLDVEPRSAELRIDDRPVVRGPEGSAVLNPGQHELVVTAPEHETVVRRLNVEAGARTQLAIALSRRGAASAAPAVPPPPMAAANAAPAPAPELESGPGPVPSATEARSVAPWIVVGISGALVIGGAVLLGMTASDIGSVEDARKHTDWASVESAYERAPGMSIAGFSMLGVGLAGVGVGLAWEFWPEEQGQPLSLRVSPSGATLRGTF